MSEHIPVLLQESLEVLNPKPGEVFVDLTLGRAGHSSEILKRLGSEGMLYCFDRDDQAIAEGSAILSKIGRFEAIRSNFASFAEELRKRGVTQVDGIFADLGVSSPQFDDPERGFSYRFDARLDMRMDRSQSLTAYEVVNTYSLNDLARIIADYGEDRDAYAIAKQIVKRRAIEPIATTMQLVEVIKSAKSPKALRAKGHPAKQTFQAIRIEVNHEEEELERLLDTFAPVLRPGGRIAIITFMSLDDRIVKRAFASLTEVEGSRHDAIPMRPEEVKLPPFVKITRKPLVATGDELLSNRRAQSAKLRAIAKRP